MNKVVFVNAEEPKEATQGSILKSGIGELFILACVKSDNGSPEYAAISLGTGNRWMDPCTSKKAATHGLDFLFGEAEITVERKGGD